MYCWAERTLVVFGVSCYQVSARVTLLPYDGNFCRWSPGSSKVLRGTIVVQGKNRKEKKKKNSTMHHQKRYEMKQQRLVRTLDPFGTGARSVRLREYQFILVYSAQEISVLS